MAKLTVNIGQSANDRTGDNLRTAFNKINTNFTELYTALGLDDNSLNLGAFEFTGSVMTTTDSSAITIDQQVTVSSDLNVGGDIVPNTDLGSSLGSATKRFKDLYISNNTIFLGNTSLGVSAGGTLEVGGSSVSSVIDYNDIQNTPTVPTLTSELTNDSGFVTAADTFNFNITGDDSTVRTVQSGSTIGIVGATGITTASDVDGNITITGTAQDFAFSSLTGTPTTVAGYGITDAYTNTTFNAQNGGITRSNFRADGIDSVDSFEIQPATELRLTVGTPNTYNITVNTPIVPSPQVSLGTVANKWSTVYADNLDGALAFSNITGTPTTLAGYGITDAQVSLVSATNIKTINGDTILGSGDLTVTGSYNDTDVSAFLNGNLDADIIPDTHTTYDLGTTSTRFKDAYIQGTVTIGTGSISSTEISNWNTAYGWGQGQNLIKAYAHVDVSSPITASADYNVDSVTSSATGKYDVTFTTALPNANYVVMLSVQTNAGSNNYTVQYYNRTTTGFQVQKFLDGTLDGGASGNFSFVIIQT